MDAKNDEKQIESATSEVGKMKLQIRTARLQKYITVDQDVSIKDVSIYLKVSGS